MEFRVISLSSIITIVILLLVSSFLISPTYSFKDDHVQRLRRIREHLGKINKTPLKTIQSVDGDVIDCVLAHEQPAFDNPMLRGQKPLDPPKRPKAYERAGINSNNKSDEIFQLWQITGETCPKGSIPIRRTSEEDIMRVGSITSFGTKYGRDVNITNGNRGSHEYAIGYAREGEYYGAKATVNVWSPEVGNPKEFSLSQIWIVAGTPGVDLNSIEVGWQISPEFYGDNKPRFFVYWTADAYKTTGCYNLLCSGFVQTNNKIALGTALNPVSTYNGEQFDVNFYVWKDPKNGNWWLEFGFGIVVGYWPSSLFTHLQDHATKIAFGGEIVNLADGGSHTTTQMGSGHFSNEGFKKASFFRNLQAVDLNNHLAPISYILPVADHPDCYDIQVASNKNWGYHFYYGGPGKSDKCP